MWRVMRMGRFLGRDGPVLGVPGGVEAAMLGAVGPVSA